MNSASAPLSTKPQKEKELILESENKQYNLKLYILSDIYLEIKEKEKITNEIYVGNFSLKNLTELSKAFRVCDSLDEAFDTIVSIYESKKIILNKNNDEMVMILKADLPNGKTEEAKLILRKKEVKKDVLIEELVKRINLLEEKNKNLEKKQAEFEKKQSEFEDLFEDEIKQKKKLKEIKFDSKIIEGDVSFILDKIIKEYPNTSIDTFQSTLLYRATRDGDNKNSFYNKVEGKRKTLSFIKTKKGIRFGCYLDIAFQKSNGERKDNKSFVFSIDRKKIYNNKPENNQINNGSDVINLYNQPIYVVNNFLSNNISYTCTKNPISFSGFEKDYELNNYELYFTVEELEVFQIN
jgi:hypothetical protein